MHNKETWNIHKTTITIVGMLCLIGIAYLAHLQGIDGKVLIGTGIAIACLANTDILKFVLSVLPKYIKHKNNG